MFYTYIQNNSGGSFVAEHERGLSHYVIIEADDARQADYLAEQVGIYFDDSRDCSCCGSRWSEAWGEGDPEPLVYGRSLSVGGKIDQSEMKWPMMAWIEGPEGYVHYKDGTVKPIYV